MESILPNESLDRELDRSDYEPSLAATENISLFDLPGAVLTRSQPKLLDQTHWAQGGRLDLEEQNEDGTEIDYVEHDPWTTCGIADADGMAEQCPAQAPPLAWSIGGYVG